MPEDFSMSKYAFSFQGSTEFGPLTPTTANRTWLTPCLFCWVYTAKRRLNTALLHTQMLLSLQKKRQRDWCWADPPVTELSALSLRGYKTSDSKSAQSQQNPRKDPCLTPAIPHHQECLLTIKTTFRFFLHQSLTHTEDTNSRSLPWPGLSSLPIPTSNCSCQNTHPEPGTVQLLLCHHHA